MLRLVFGHCCGQLLIPSPWVAHRPRQRAMEATGLPVQGSTSRKLSGPENYPEVVPLDSATSTKSPKRNMATTGPEVPLTQAGISKLYLQKDKQYVFGFADHVFSITTTNSAVVALKQPQARCQTSEHSQVLLFSRPVLYRRQCANKALFT